MNHIQPAPTVVDLAEHATQTVRDLDHLTRFHDAITHAGHAAPPRHRPHRNTTPTSRDGR